MTKSWLYEDNIFQNRFNFVILIHVLVCFYLENSLHGRSQPKTWGGVDLEKFDLISLK